MGSDRVPVSTLINEGILIISDGYRAKNNELSNEGIPFARAGNVNGEFDFQNADRVPPETLQRVGIKKSRPGDVVFTSKGTVGRFAYVRDTTPEFVYSPQLCFWRSNDPSVIDPRWLYYWMNGREFFLQYKGVSGQTDMADYVSLRDQRAMWMTIPPLPEQKRIAHILGTLDDKIELNRRMNKTLEEMARALFKSWFVDFDPVHAKAAGRKPTGMDDATAALFPDSFVESELGLIPKGWEVSTIGKEARVVGGSTPSTKRSEYWEGGEFHWVTPKDLSTLESKVLLSSSRTITEAGLSQISSGLLPENTVLLSSRAPVGYLALTRVKTAINQGFIAMICDDRLPPEYVILWAESIMDQVIQAATGTTFLEISKRTFRPFPVIVPPQAMLNASVKPIRTLFRQVTVNELESMSLAHLRDALLPTVLNPHASAP